MQLDWVITPAIISLLKPVIDSRPGAADTLRLRRILRRHSYLSTGVFERVLIMEPPRMTLIGSRETGTGLCPVSDLKATGRTVCCLGSRQRCLPANSNDHQFPQTEHV